MSDLRILCLTAFALLALFISPSNAEACSCLPPDLVRTTSDSDYVMSGKIVRKRRINQYRYFQFEVGRTYKGCYLPGERVILRSMLGSSACGIDLQKGTKYLITGYRTTFSNGNPGVSINACGHNVEWKSTSPTDREFLNNRYVDCPSQSYQQCADGSYPVSCTIDPCTTYSGKCTGSCVTNYCGGCNQEFYDANGDAICESDWSVTPP